MTEGRQVLYRYRHLQGKHREWTKQILIDSKLYFSSPLSFNDPFDCKILFQSSLSSKELKKRFDTLLKKTLNSNWKQQKDFIIERVSESHSEKFVEYMTKSLQHEVNNVGILSLSGVNDNILLWSHYAFGHAGLCIGFIATNVSPFFGLAQKVHYSHNYPNIDILGTSPIEMVEAFLLTKAQDWKYEAEWRIIDHNEGPGLKQFPEELMTEIIFGARMSREDKKEVMSWLEKRNSPVAILQAVLEAKTYSLRIEPYVP